MPLTGSDCKMTGIVRLDRLGENLFLDTKEVVVGTFA